MTCVIGLTGSIASGKSTVSLMFDDFGIPVIDADKLAREAVKPGQPALAEIASIFGEDMLFEDGSLDRKKLGQIVFSDEEKRKQLNSIVHPEVRRLMLKQRDAYIAQGERAVVLDIPLLFESGLESYVEKIIVVYVDRETQLRRLMERDGYSEREADTRINVQMPVKDKAALADAVINNNGSKREAYEQLQGVLKKWDILQG